MSAPIGLVITGVLETMNVVKELARERDEPVPVSFIEAQRDLVNAAADLANELDRDTE
ncbi:MAG: hypothetical protein JJ916_04300 [Phycisphaerales bacterium]|nr:hypothetical protein [Phycisphaerales bacterium]